MYTLNTQAAIKADTIGAYINETGKYVGEFLRAEQLVSAGKGTKGIGFTFKADDGRESRFDIWTHKGNGEELSGLNQVNAIMVCLQVRQMAPVTHNVKKWDPQANAEAIMPAQCFVELMRKPIGLLLRSEEYEKMADGMATGDTGWRMGVFAIFQAGTELMASEILSRKTKPEQLAKVTEMLADKPLKKRAGSHGRSGTQNNGTPPESIQFDDDIPF